MKYAKFSDDFLSYFRLDDSGETLVLTDKYGFTRAVKLLPYEERQQGEWIYDSDHSITIDMYKCSVCGCGGHTHFNFCPDCGADMRGTKE